MKVGSLFSGIGGIELGFEREGFETKWFVEKDAFCQSVLRKHWPKVKIYGNIKSVDFRKTEPIDVLTGGFPCQDISVAGKGKGITGERSGLWKEYFRAIREIRPKFAVIENVSILTKRGLNVILGDLTQIRYDAEWFCLQARDVGAPHRRERIFIIAYPNKNGESIISINDKKRQEQLGEQPITNSDSNRFNESNSTSEGLEAKVGKVSESKQVGKGWVNESSISSSFFITNDWSERVQRFAEESLQGEQGFSWCQDVRRIEDLKGRSDIPEPLIRGKGNGVSNRVDRTKSIGNAVVPQVAQFIARRIKEVSLMSTLKQSDKTGENNE